MNSETKKNLINQKTLFLILITFSLLYSFNYIAIINVRGQTVTDISVQTAYNMIANTTQYPDLVILDVRNYDEFNLEHLHNATLIPVHELPTRFSELEPYNETEIIVYCRTGVRSRQGSDVLAANNFTKVYNMLGGISAWKEAGYEVWTKGSAFISFSFNIFVLATLGIAIFLIMYFKVKKKFTIH